MRILKTIVVCCMAFTVAACTNIISDGVKRDGNIDGEVTFPDMDKAILDGGIFPNAYNLSAMGEGMNKKQIYYLIGRPHFKERTGAREWDYIMNFRQADGSVKVCQYKILFDKDKLSKSFFWHPHGCAIPSQPRPQPVAVVKQPQFKYPEIAPLEILFYFDKSGAEHIKPVGKEQLMIFVQGLANKPQDTKIMVSGYADIIGSDSYNDILSARRAITVKRYLIALGVEPRRILTSAKGSSQPKARCDRRQSFQTQVDCLAIDRRVVVDYKK